MCGPLLKVQDEEVGLVHQSVRDYLLRQMSDTPALKAFRFQPEEAHLRIAWECLDCLQSELTNRTDGSIRPAHHLLEYSIFCWPRHVYSSGALENILQHPSGFFHKKSSSRDIWWATYIRRNEWRALSGVQPLLHMACYTGVIAWMRELLKKRNLFRFRTINRTNNEGYNALQFAFAQGHDVAVRLLLDCGAKVNRKDSAGWTALSYAARDGDKVAIRLLLDRGAEVNTRNNNGWTALHYVASNGHAKALSLLLTRGADINIRDSSGKIAARYAKGEHCKALLMPTSS